MAPSPADQIRDMPWLATLDVRRRLAWPYIRLQFAFHGIDWGERWRIFGAPILQRHRGSVIRVGDGLAKQVAEAIAVHRGEVPARFVHIPLKVVSKQPAVAGGSDVSATRSATEENEDQ